MTWIINNVLNSIFKKFCLVFFYRFRNVNPDISSDNYIVGQNFLMFVLKEGIDRRLEDTLKVSSHASLTKDSNLHVCQH